MAAAEMGSVAEVAAAGRKEAGRQIRQKLEHYPGGNSLGSAKEECVQMFLSIPDFLKQRHPLIKFSDLLAQAQQTFT